MLSPKLKDKFDHLTYLIYRKNITADLNLSDEFFFPFLRKNRLDHFFAIKFTANNKELLNEYEDYVDKVYKSLKKLKTYFKTTSFMVIKTFSSYPHITSDIDIITKENLGTLNKKKVKLSFPFDINSKISWTYDEEISHKFIWNNTKYLNFKGMKILVPNPNLDILIRMAHLPFEQGEMRLGELLHIFSQFSYVNWELLEQESLLNNWSKTFNRTRELLNHLYDSLFLNKNKVNFPYHLSYFLLARAVIEKRAWKKILGARYIIKDRLKI